MERNKAGKIVMTGILGANLLLAPHLRAKESQPETAAYDVKIRAPSLIMKMQVNHTWVEFSVGKNRYIAYDEKIESFSTKGVVVYKIENRGPNEKLTEEEQKMLFDSKYKVSILSEDEKNRMLGNSAVRDPVLERLDEAKHVHTPSHRRPAVITTGEKTYCINPDGSIGKRVKDSKWR
jgi:hypothetical protein